MAQHNNFSSYLDYPIITDKFKLEPHHVFGFSRNVRSNLFFLDDQTIIFPSGKFCVVHHTFQKWNKFIPIAKESQGIEALALSPDRHFLAVSECRDQGTITVFDLQHPEFCQRMVLTSDTSMVQEFVCMAFSSDSKYLIGYSGKTERSLFYWEWQKNDLIVKKKITKLGDVSQVSFHPMDNTQICVSGDQVFSIFKLCNDKSVTLRETNFFKKEKEDILCHAWISEDQIVAGTKSGNLLLLFLKFKHVHKLGRPVPSSVTTGPGVTAITPLGNGFACSAGPDLVCLFEKTEGKEFFRKTMEIKIPEDPCLLPDKAEQQTITSMCVSPLQETMAISTDKGQMFYINFNLLDWRLEKQAFKHLFHTLHSRGITSLSVCSDKPLFATCSTDNIVRIWNHKTSSLVLYTQFPEQPLSVALHPTGLSILVSFPEKICLMNVLVDGFRISKEFSVSSCTKCVFNHNGSKFAAVRYNRIYIFDIRDTYQKMDLQHHRKQVLSVKWSDDDARLVSCGADGAVCLWNALTGTCEAEFTDTTCTFTDVIFMPNNGHVIALSSDDKLKDFKDGVLLQELQLEGAAITALAVTHCGQAIMVGTSAGTVRVLQYPLQIGDWTEHQAHSGPITHIAITPLDRFLLTASEDGSLLIWTISDHIGHKLRVWKEMDQDEEVLCTRGYLEKRDRSLEKAKKRLELSELKCLVECGETDAQCAKKVDSMMLKHKMMVHDLKAQSKRHEDEVERLKACCDELKEEHARVLKDKEHSHYRTVLEDLKMKKELEIKVMTSERNWEEKLRQIKEQHRRTMKQMKESYEIKLEEMKAKFPKTRYLTIIGGELYLKHKEEPQQVKDTSSSLDHEKDLMEEKKLVQEIKLKTELVDQKRTIRRLQEDLKRTQDHHRNALTQVKDLNTRIEGLKIINSTQQEEISALYAKLEAVKSSDSAPLQSQIKQLRQERDQLRTSSQLKNVAQLHKRIEDFKTTIKQLKAEQLQIHRTHQDIIDGLKKKLVIKDRELCNERQKIRSMSTQLEKIKADIHKGTSFLQEPKLLRDHYLRLQRHCL